LWVVYRIDKNGAELVPTTITELDDGGDYRFNLLIADGGQLVCVHEVNRGNANSSLNILYDATTGESWPRDSTNYHFNPETKAKWRERFERVRREHPSFRIPVDLLQ
jgi:hypothetical protein